MRKGSIVLFLILAVAAAALAALLIFGKIENNLPLDNTSVIGNDRQISNLKSLGTSDKVSDIQKDYDATNLNDVDVEMQQVSKDSEGL